MKTPAMHKGYRVNGPFSDRNWREDSETEWRGQKKTETKHKKLVVLKARATVQFF